MRFLSSRFRISDFGFRIVVAFCVAIGAAFIGGCEDTPTTSGRQSQQEKLRRHDRGEVLLGAAASQLSDLPSAVDVEIRPPAVILDASKSANGEVVAICTASPSEPDGPLNYVVVPAGNSRFRSLGVKSGDILKFFLREDETVDEERQQSGFASRLAVEFTVAQVIDENSLFIEKGVPASAAKEYMEQVVDETTLADAGNLPRGVLVPAKIEIWRNMDDQLIEINQKLGLYAERRLPPVGWQPSPDSQVISQIVAWLNQWLRQSEPKADWKPDPMLSTIDPALLSDAALAPYISEAALAAHAFQPHDGRLLQEAVWHRDISRWAQGANFNDVARATALFDWTVRNVALVADEDAVAHRPWEILLYGRGTAEQRAWVFAMLCRQQGMDVVMLATGPSEPKFWLPALVVDKQLYLFDTRLGLPIPGAGGDGVATLEQVRADDGLLRQLDLADAPYPVTSDSLQTVVPLMVADPFDLTQRAWFVETKLTGDHRMVLTSRPSEVAALLKSVGGLAEAKLWEVPFRTLRDQLLLGRAARRRAALEFEPFAVRPLLWKARTRHFQGRRPVEKPDQEETIDDHREAAQLYTSRSVRPTERAIARTESIGERRVDNSAKLNATYWVGLLSFDDGRLDVAAHWLSRPELTAAESPWAAGARYNLARTNEAQEKFEEAIKLLEQDESSPQRHGNRLRAERLKARLAETKKSE